jgi:hypothetical protein
MSAETDRADRRKIDEYSAAPSDQRVVDVKNVSGGGVDVEADIGEERRSVPFPQFWPTSWPR